MSDLTQIETALARLFDEESQRIVFWNDPEQEFVDTLPAIHLDDVNIFVDTLRQELEQAIRQNERVQIR
jgi:hypothetical protein